MKADKDVTAKMKVTLIQIDLVMGSRVILSILKDNGYDARALQVNVKYTDVLKKADLEAIFRYSGGARVVGLSFNSFYAPIARQLAGYLKSRGIEYIIAGGTHATALPDEVIEYADVVVRYEAELTFPRVLESLGDPDEMGRIKGIVFRKDGSPVHTDGAPEIVWDLDTLPFQSVDTGLIKYFDLKRKVYTPERRDLFPGAGGCYFILASRGCPFSCTYCSNSLYHSIDPRFRKVRKRSVDNILSEMSWAAGKGFKSFYIADDSFFSFSKPELEAFGRGYKREIKKPFSVVGLNPKALAAPEADKKLKILLDCGLSDVRIGV
ncbi:MAG: cobalamin-dependent protein, partial [Candidatus Omnitrophota bacterium]